MKTKRLSESLVDYIDNHADEFGLQYRWKDGKPVCPYCNSLDKQYHCADGRYKCGHCNKRYSSLVGTAFQNTKLALKTILKGIFFLLVTRSCSAVALSSYLNVNYDTAYFFIKRMQMATKQDIKLFGQIAMDEVYMGGKWRNKHYRKKRAILKENAIILPNRSILTGRKRHWVWISANALFMAEMTRSTFFLNKCHHALIVTT